MVFIAWFILAVVVGAIAGQKGRSGVGYFFLSLFLSPLIGGIILLISGEDKTKVEAVKIAEGNEIRCYFCAELIKREAKICKHCQKTNHPAYHGARLEIQEIKEGSVLHGTPAKVGDVVFKYNDRIVSGSAEHLISEAQKSVGSQAKITLVRDAEQIEIEVLGGPIGISMETRS